MSTDADARAASIVRFAFRPERAAEARAVVEGMLRVTAAHEGLERLDVWWSADAPHEWALLEVWTTPESEAAYRAFRATEAGRVEGLAELLAGPPTVEAVRLLPPLS